MNCASNIITANFSGGKTHATTARVYQWSRGIELCITGADNLPQTFKAHFSVQKRGGVATTIVGIDERVDVPNVLFTIGKDIHVWLGASETEDDAEILYTVDIPVAPAPMPEYYDAEDTGVFDAVVEQVADYAATATAAANSAGASATAAAGSASAAAASASSAAGSAGAAEQARADAVTAKGQAETAAQTATEKALQTAQNASQAALDAGRAESAAERAELAETGAGAAKTAAEAAEQSAAASAATADEKATLAGQSATAAAGSASAAAQSAASIEGDVQIASQKASEAQTAAGQAVTAKEAAQTAQQGAETAATNAGQSASTATAKASEAAQSASGAAQSKTDAEAAAARAEQAAASLTVDSALSDSSTNPVQNKVITAEITDVKTALNEAFSTEVASVNIFDEAHNATPWPSDSQYTDAIVYLDGYVGDLVASTAGSGNSGYFRTPTVKDANGNTLTSGWLSGTVYNTALTRSGKKITIPEGGATLEFAYRNSTSTSQLVHDVMVTKGSTCPDTYVVYADRVVVNNSGYITADGVEDIIDRIIYVSTEGSDSNDGLTFANAFATFGKAFTVGKHICAERGVYDEAINISGMDNVHLFAYNNETYSHSVPSRAKVTISHVSSFVNCNNLRIEDFVFTESGASNMSVMTISESSNVFLSNCEANGSNGSMGFDVTDSDVVFEKCSASENYTDGFNFHGYGTTVMYDCDAIDNGDDGCSHHDGCIGTIYGGRFNGNTKCGIAPAYGATVNIYDAFCKNNTGSGIGYLSTNNGHANMNGIISNCCMVGNGKGLSVNALCSVTAINCVYSGNTTDKDVAGTLVEY